MITHKTKMSNYIIYKIQHFFFFTVIQIIYKYIKYNKTTKLFSIF